jgi:hypothetical protein
MAVLPPGVPTIPADAVATAARIKRARGKVILADHRLDRAFLLASAGHGHEKDLGEAVDLLVEALQLLGGSSGDPHG